MTLTEVKEIDRDQILAMEPGPELDALMAEIMGWRDIETGYWYDEQNGVAHEKSVYMDGSPISRDMFAPSTDIATAMDVARQSIRYVLRAWNDRPWNEAEITIEGDQTSSAKATTMPLAICRAALLANQA